MKIRITVAPLQKALRGIERQAKFGASQAMNEWVEVYKLRAIDHLPRFFRIRSGWLAKGFKTEHAKRDKLEAMVGHKDEYMKWQAEGGNKPVGPKATAYGQGIPQQGAMPATQMPIAMPRGMSGERPTYRGANWAGQLLRSLKMFESKQAKVGQKRHGSKSQRNAIAAAAKTRAASNRLVFLKHAAIPTIAIRIGSGNGRGKYLPLWFLKNAPVKIPKRWKFYEEGEAFAKSNLPPMMDWHINKWINKIGTP
jgi:hypothetical protein